MAEQYDLEAVVRWSSEGFTGLDRELDRIQAAMKEVQQEADRLDKSQRSAARGATELEDRITVLQKRLRNNAIDYAIKQTDGYKEAVENSSEAVQKAIDEDAAAIEKQRQATAKAAAAFIAQGEANEKAAKSAQASARAKEEDRAASERGEMAAKETARAIKAEEDARKAELASLKAAILQRDAETGAKARQRQAARDNAAAIKGEETARKSELAALRASIQARYADADAQKKQIENLPRLRYALYDVSTTATFTGAALLGLSTAAYAVSISFDRAFADVQRTSGATGLSLQAMRKDFDELYRSIPVSFADLAGIGTLGGQLNISAGNLANFTEQVAKFSATSNVSVDAAATAFGRLDQLLPDVQGDYEKLSDAILKVGVNSVATEDQIISITSQLAGVATTAKLSSNELIALSGTLASLGTAPELARGAITRLFANIETAIAGGGERLAAFARASGRTSAQFQKDWGTDSYTVIVDLFDTLGASGGNLGNELRNLGITASRDIPVFQKLAQRSDILRSTFDDATNSAGETARQYSILTSTVAEKINILVNNFNSFVAAVGDSSSGIGLLVDAGIGLLNLLRGIVETPVGGALAAVAVASGAVAGAFLLVFGAATRMVASYAALVTAKRELNIQGTGLIGVYRGLTAAMNENTLAASGNAAGGIKLRGILSGLGRAAGVASAAAAGLAVYEGVASALQDLQLQQSGLAKSSDEWTKAIQSNDQALTDLLTRASNFTDGSIFSQSALYTSGGDLDNFLGFLDQAFYGGGAAKLQDQILEIDASLAAFAQSGNADLAQQKLEEFRRILVDEGTWSQSAFEKHFAQTIEALDGGSLAVQQDADAIASAIDDIISSFTEVAQGSLDVQNSIYDLGQSLGENGRVFDEFSVAGRANMAALLDTIQAVAAQTPGDAAATAANLQALYDTLIQGAGVSANSLIFLAQMISGLRSAAGGQTASATINFTNLLGGMSTGATKAARSVGSAAKQVRTLVDYANDLQSVFSRSFDIRFKSQLAMDDVADSWETLAKRIEDARVKLMGLQADKSIAEYFKSVADLYGDSLRGDKLAAEIADLNQQIAETQAEATTELNGNTKGARQNRKVITDLVKQYEDYITALAEGGADQATLNAAVNKSRAEFIAQAQALGYSNAELQPYIASFNDLGTAIARIPRNITVTPNIDPALQALNEFVAKASQAGASAGAGFASGMQAGLAKTARGIDLQNQIAQMQATLAQYIASGNIAGARYMGQAIAEYSRRLASGNYYSGGYTGRGGKYEPAGVVHRGEYVIPKEQVNQRTGLPYASALGNLQAGTRAPRSGYAAGGFVGGGGFGGVVVLDQAQYNGLVRAMRESGGGNMNAQTLQGVVNGLNARDSTLGRG